MMIETTPSYFDLARTPRLPETGFAHEIRLPASIANMAALGLAQ